MRRRTHRNPAIAVIFVLGCLLGAAFLIYLLGRKPVDPHAGQVLVNDGFNDVWITPIEGVEPSILTKEDFSRIDGAVAYIGGDYDTILGVDVSEHQWKIDWEKVADSGVRFAYIRSGYRGFTQGGLFEDPWFRTNVEGAGKAGLDVGVYFYSQAVNVAEAIEEARFVLEQINDCDLSLPVMFDWEKLEDEPEARTNDLDPAIIGDCAVAFCETIRAAGYEAGVYFNLQLGYYSLDLSRMKDCMLWLADPGGYPKFYYEYDIWQYGEGAVNGIDGQVDLNLMFVKKEQSSESPAT